MCRQQLDEIGQAARILKNCVEGDRRPAFQTVLYYCNYYDHHHRGHLMANQTSASGILPDVSLTPYACRRPHATRTATSPYYDGYPHQRSSDVSYGYSDGTQMATGHARVRTSVQSDTRCTTDLHGEATSASDDSSAWRPRRTVRARSMDGDSGAVGRSS